MSKNDDIIWICTADLSWGGCAAKDLIAVRKSDLSEDDLEAIEDAAADEAEDEIADILLSAKNVWSPKFD